MSRDIESAAVLASPLQFRRAHDLRAFAMALRHLKSHLWVALLVLLAIVGIALLFIAGRSQSYTAVARIGIEDRRVQLANQGMVVTPGPVTEAILRTQIEVLGSADIAKLTISKLSLSGDPEFEPGRLRRILDGLEHRPAETPPDAQMQQALIAFARKRSIRRIGESDVVELRFTSASPARAELVARTMLAIYLDSLRKQNESLVRAATPGLREQIQEVGTAARVISAPAAPAYGDGPPAANILIASLMLGSLFGISAALILGATRHSLWRPEELVENLGAGQAWMLRDLNPRFRRLPLQARPGPNDPRPADGDATRPRQAEFDSVMGQVAAATKRSHLPSTIGISAFARGAGRSATALGLARTMASAGEEVLLVDADLEDPQLSRDLAPGAPGGLLEALLEPVLWEGLCVPVEERVTFLPLVGAATPLARYRMESGRLNEILIVAQRRFSAIILDLPLMPSSAAIFDATTAIGYRLLVIHPSTGAGRIAQAIAASPQDSRRPLAEGILFNRLPKAEPSWIELRR